ncbi:hypothetical protein ID866_5749 [Astraeus odoratus]|nr:hypothetical protein ID866_5749 [Astraeus odoratus]
MSDLTVLVSPTSIYPQQSRSFGLNFSCRSQNDLTTNRPVMVVLEDVDSDETPPSPVVGTHMQNNTLLSPPRNTFRALRSSKSPLDVAQPPIPCAIPELSSRSQSYTADQSKGAISAQALLALPLKKREEPCKPPPLLYRPTTFWRKTRRSGVTGASYSPSSFLVRRSTFIAAGLSQDMPGCDLSALGVESRVPILILGPDYSI